MKRTILILALAISIYGCKKDKTTEPTSTTSLSSDANAETGLGSNYNHLNGLMFAQKTLGTNDTLVYMSGAFFFATQISPQQMDSDTLTGVNAGTLKINSNTMVYNAAFQGIYLDPLTGFFGIGGTADYSSGATWHLTGNSNFASFDINVARGFPSISNINFPDSVSQSTGFTINFATGNFTNTDSIYVEINGNDNTEKSLAGNATSVTFTPADLSSLSGNLTLSITTENYSNKTVGSKNYLFVMNYVINKSLLLKP
jgi:hypothetical protein